MSTSAVKPFDQNIRIWSLRALFLMLLPLMLFARPIEIDSAWIFDIIEIIGTFFIIFGILGRFWAILYIGGHKNFRIVEEGPYSICRHPLYLFSTISVVGLGLMLGSVVLAVLFGGLTFLILNATASREEAFLRSHFGPAYDDYAARIPRILPQLGSFQTAKEITVAVPQLRANFFDALVFLSFIPLAELMEWVKEDSAIWSFPIF